MSSNACQNVLWENENSHLIELFYKVLKHGVPQNTEKINCIVLRTGFQVFMSL